MGGDAMAGGDAAMDEDAVTGGGAVAGGDAAMDEDAVTGGEHALLEVQRLDIEAGQLRYRRDNLEVRADLNRARAEQSRQQSLIDTVALERVEAVTRQKRLEDEAAIVAARADRDDNRLYSGEIQSLRDLQALQDEIAGLRSRQSDLEDRAIEALEDAERLDEQMSELEAAKAGADREAGELSARLEAAEAEIESRLGAVAEARAAAAAGIDPGLLARYERLLPVFGNSAAVSFDPARGCGCPSAMPAVEVDRVKRCPPGSVLDCEECGRIVLR